MRGTVAPYLFVALIALGCASVGYKTEKASDDPQVADKPTAIDLQIIRRADAVLSDEGKWNRRDTRECKTTDQKWSLYCALYQASLDVTGTFQHRRAALEETRKTVEQLTQGMNFEHRLMDYNNLSSTRLDDIKMVLQVTASRLAAVVHE